MDSMLLAKSECFVGKKFRTNLNCSGSGDDELECRDLIYAAGDDERNLRKRNLEGAYVLNAARRSCWENLYEI